MSFRRIFPAATLIAIVACGSSSSGGGGVSASQACADYAAARCKRDADCTVYGFQTRYGDDAACRADESAFCMAAVSAPSTARTPASYEQCASAYPTIACADYLGNDTPAVCNAVPGPFAIGASCTFSSQCQSAYCDVPDGFACGRCEVAPKPGDPCSQTSQKCGVSLYCAKATMTCVPGAQPGAACDTDNPCNAGYSCVGITPMSHGSCQAQVGTAGAACDPKAAMGPTCDATKGLVCNTQTKQCVTQTYAAAGQPCGAIDGAFVPCAAEGFCRIAMGQTQGTCIAASAEGGPCDTANGPLCAYESRCVVASGTSGTCHVPSASLCP